MIITISRFWLFIQFTWCWPCHPWSQLIYQLGSRMTSQLVISSHCFCPKQCLTQYMPHFLNLISAIDNKTKPPDPIANRWQDSFWLARLLHCPLLLLLFLLLLLLLLLLLRLLRILLLHQQFLLAFERGRSKPSGSILILFRFSKGRKVEISTMWKLYCWQYRYMIYQYIVSEVDWNFGQGIQCQIARPPSKIQKPTPFQDSRAKTVHKVQFMQIWTRICLDSIRLPASQWNQTKIKTMLVDISGQEWATI